VEAGFHGMNYKTVSVNERRCYRIVSVFGTLSIFAIWWTFLKLRIIEGNFELFACVFTGAFACRLCTDDIPEIISHSFTGEWYRAVFQCQQNDNGRQQVRI